MAAIQAAELEKKKVKWASYVETEYSRCRTSRLNAERQWYINLAFVNGRHNIAPLRVGGDFRLQVPKAPPWRVRMVINKIRTAVRTEVSKLSSSRPIPTVIPATSEDEDYNAALVAEQLLKTEFGSASFETEYRSFIWWGSVCGTSFLKSYWDPYCKDMEAQPAPQPMIDPTSGMPIMGPDGQPMMLNNEVLGKIKTERITPFHVFVPDLLTEDLNKQPYLIHVTTRSPLEVKKMFGVDATPDSKSSNTILDSAFVITKNSDASHLDAVVIKEMWLKPNTHPDFPEGGLITVVNSRVVQHKEKWPWPFSEYPFYKYSGIPTGGFYSDSMIVDLIPLNREYNRTRSQMVEIKNVMGKPKFFYAKGSVNPRQISSEPGQGIPYELGYPQPTPIPGMEVPVSMHNELDRLNADFDDISGQHEISRGDTPPQVTSATAIAFLQEQDDTKLTPTVASIERSIELLGKHYLMYVAHFWDEPRLIKVVGKDKTVEAIEWKGSSLRNNTDVKVQTGSALPQSKAARQAMVTEFMQNGWFDVATGLEIMELSSFDKVVDELLVDKKQAQRENLKMMKLTAEEYEQYQQEFQQQQMQALQQQGLMGGGLPPVGPGGPEQLMGGPPVGPDPMGNPMGGMGISPEMMQPAPPMVPVNSWDNHELHIMYHNQFRKTQEFELAEQHIKEEFEKHVQLHQVSLSALVQGQAGVLSAPGGGEEPPEEEQPPPE